MKNARDDLVDESEDVTNAIRKLSLNEDDIIVIQGRKLSKMTLYRAKGWLDRHYPNVPIMYFSEGTIEVTTEMTDEALAKLGLQRIKN